MNTMDPIPVVRHLFVSPRKGAPMEERQFVEAVWRSGLKGDRWFRHWSLYFFRVVNAWRKGKRYGETNLSIITLADIATANAGIPEPFTPAEMRRNVVIDGALSLNELVGVTFRIGPVLVRGDNLCTPCALPPKRAGKLGCLKTFLREFGHDTSDKPNRGGLRCVILRGGTIRVGDGIKL